MFGGPLGGDGWWGEPRASLVWMGGSRKGQERTVGCAFIAHHSGGWAVRNKCAPYGKAKPRAGRGLTAQVRACNRQLARGPGWGLNGDA